MSTTSNAGGSSSSKDLIARLSQMSNRTNLMIVDATLHALPADEQGYADAAAEVRALSRRIAQAAQDFQATLHPGVIA